MITIPGIANSAYDRDASSDDSQGLSPRNRPHGLNHRYKFYNVHMNDL